jgi:hypothetical protein
MHRVFLRGLKSWSLLGLLFAATNGCAASPPPFHARYAEIGKGALAEYRGDRPLVVEFQPGERLPVDLRIESEDFELVPAQPPLEFVAKRRVFVRFGSDGMRMSSDGVNFDQKPREPGRFQLGFSATKTTPPKLQAHVVAPKR